MSKMYTDGEVEQLTAVPGGLGRAGHKPLHGRITAGQCAGLEDPSENPSQIGSKHLVLSMLCLFWPQPADSKHSAFNSILRKNKGKRSHLQVRPARIMFLTASWEPCH